MSKGAPDFDHMIYVRLIEACNLHCQHCFIPNNPKRMDWNNIEQIPAKVRSFARPGQVLLFQLHGGANAGWSGVHAQVSCVFED